MGNSFSRFLHLLRCRRPRLGQARHLYPIPIYRKRAAGFAREHPGAPASVNRPHGVPRPIPLYFNQTPWRYCGRPQAPKSLRFGDQRILRRPPPGRRASLLRVLDTIREIKRMRRPPPPRSREKTVTRREPRMPVEKASVLKTTEDGNGIPGGSAIRKSGMEPSGAGPSSIDAQQLLGQAQKSSAQELPKHKQPRSTGPLTHSVATEDSKSKGGFAGSAASPEMTARRASKRKQPMLFLDKEQLSLMDLPLAWHRDDDLPPPPKLPALVRTVIHNVVTKDSKSQEGFAGNASPPAMTSRIGSKRKQPTLMDKELSSVMDQPQAWNRGELPLPPKLPCFDPTIRIC